MRVDAHTHILPPSVQNLRAYWVERDATFAQLFAHPRARMAGVEDLLAALDSAEMHRAVVAGMGWTNLALARQCNDYILESYARWPQRLIPFISINPLWGEEALREVERCAQGGARGVGELHPDPQGWWDTDADAYLQALASLLRQYRLILLVHASEPVGHLYPGKGKTTPDRLLHIRRVFTGIPIVFAHMGGGLPFYTLMPEVAQALQDTYFDSAATPFLYTPRVYRSVVDLVGVERVLFATDFPLLGYPRALRHLAEGGLTPQEQALVLGGNAYRLLHSHESK
ncbi:MAG: amidohydrolase [Dehalococcoidia bacterium]|nr:amidohydrolase [Dehalococcoidia bacterium]MDW8119158.1 amidohydrolase family protein [Chloroflexota bacterium]